MLASPSMRAAALALLACAALARAGSCRDSKLCCSGRDSSCVVQKAPLNTIVEDLTDKPCYCDHACLKLGDCCPDFKEACGVVDCELSAWGPWSECDARCGAGSMERTRRVLRAAAHGGHRCPGLAQRRACHAHHACPDHTDAALRETALLLPASLSLSRRMNDTMDIRANLRVRNPDDPESNYHREYCVEFEVLKVSKSCHREADYQSLAEGGRVCVRCEAAALRRSLEWRCGGHGVPDAATRFSALASPHCHGKWRRLPPADAAADAACCRQPNFIFI